MKKEFPPVNYDYSYFMQQRYKALQLDETNKIDNPVCFKCAAIFILAAAVGILIAFL